MSTAAVSTLDKILPAPLSIIPFTSSLDEKAVTRGKSVLCKYRFDFVTDISNHF
jgi:hypothetical protein